MAVEDFPYDPEFGEPYNSRERFFVERLGNAPGGCTPAGRGARRPGSPCGSTSETSSSNSSTRW